MKFKNLLSLLYTLGAILVIAITYSFTTASIEKIGKEYQPKWQNLKVLPQDISKDSLMNLMEGYNKALGVKCSHCHAPSKNEPRKLDFADDSKMAKNIARGMIKMTHDINENYFKPYYPDPKPTHATDVSCVMCHRGTAKPKEYLENISSLYPVKETKEE